MKKNLITMLLLLIAVTALFTACGGKKDVIKIGVVGAHSGDLASYGLPTVKAAELVAAKWNENGGVLGKQVELVVEDDVCKPEVAANSAAKVVGEGVVAVIGHICSGATKSALGIYNEAGIPCISPSATNPPLTKSGEYPNFFRTIAPDDAQAETDANFIVNNLKLKKVAILHDRQDYGKGFADFCVAALEKMGVEIVLYEGITDSALDYSAILTKVAASGAEGIVYGGYHPEASKLVQQMSQIGLNIPFISDDGVKDDTFIKVAGKFSEGVYASGPVDTSSNAMNIQAVKDHVEAYGEDPGAFFINAYAASEALMNAIDKAGSTDGAAIMKALRSEYVETPLGKISFDDKGDAIGVGFSVYQVQNGTYVELK
ncbi:MAG: branched chain amino acid ABC transporter substrate-binding protein [Spirochaetales bacterium]|nr:MAG: branched chain amino acid ABC transporter substrate-binding protein [Spirochaetales bacterium]